MSKFCGKCGFRTNLTYCPNCGNDSKIELICLNCGRIYEDNKISKYCDYCLND